METKKKPKQENKLESYYGPAKVAKEKAKKSGMTEKQLCQSISAYLHVMSLSRKFAYFHVPNEYVAGYTGIGWEKMQKSMGKIAGAPDYVIAKGGKCIFIEVKTKTGKLTANQKAFQDWCAKACAPYYVCRSLDEVEEVLKNLK